MALPFHPKPAPSVLDHVVNISRARRISLGNTRLVCELSTLLKGSANRVSTFGKFYVWNPISGALTHRANDFIEVSF